jgi:hypothetical protein
MWAPGQRDQEEEEEEQQHQQQQQQQRTHHSSSTYGSIDDTSAPCSTYCPPPDDPPDVSWGDFLEFQVGQRLYVPALCNGSNFTIGCADVCTLAMSSLVSCVTVCFMLCNIR